MRLEKEEAAEQQSAIDGSNVQATSQCSLQVPERLKKLQSASNALD